MGIEQLLDHLVEGGELNFVGKPQFRQPEMEGIADGFSGEGGRNYERGVGS